jgi:YidC/Oxa1 family membrane protein insertase
MAYREGAFDHYDSILCVGPHHISEIQKYEETKKLQPKQLIQAGYYRLERIHAAYQKYSADRPPASGKGTVLVAPSWGPSNVLESCGLELVDVLLKAGYEVIVRPHPEAVRRSIKLVNSFETSFGGNPAFTLERSVATDDSILRADVLICDCSGIALEYALGTERPVLFLDVPVKIHNQKYQELGTEPLELSLRPEIGVIIPPENLNEVPGAISKLKAESANYKQRLSELREELVFAFGRSSEMGVEHIINLVTETHKEGNS